MKAFSMALGVDVYVTPDVPRVALGERFITTSLGDRVAWVGPAQHCLTNAWLRVTFGVYNMVPDGEVYATQLPPAIYMNERTYARLADRLQARPYMDLTDAFGRHWNDR